MSEDALPDDRVFYAMPADADTALISFSAMGTGRGSFDFFRVLDPLPQYSKLLVRDPSSCWYNNGLPGVGRPLDLIADRIERELLQLGAREVIAIGYSMGAYAAILYGCLIGASRIVALSPQTLLDPILRHSPPPGIELQAPDLVPVVRSAPDVEIELVAAWDDLLDVFHAHRLAHLPWVRLLAMPGRTHEFLADLHRSGQLVPLIAQLVTGEVPEQCEPPAEIEADVAARIADTVYAAQRGDWVTAAERIEPVAEDHPKWNGPNAQLERALAKIAP